MTKIFTQLVLIIRDSFGVFLFRAAIIVLPNDTLDELLDLIKKEDFNGSNK